MASTIDENKTKPRLMKATEDPAWFKGILIAVALVFLSLFLLLPLVSVFHEALIKGVEVYAKIFTDEATIASIKLTLLVAAIAVPLNTIFGVAAAWAICNFKFKGKGFLTTLIELPIWVSPVIGGLIYVLVFGKYGLLGEWLEAHNLQIIFNTPGIVLATLFVTFPYVARSLIPLMQALGNAEEEAALTLGAKGWQIFFRVTLPKIKWGLIYGIILCNARAMGEFGAVSVVSGHIRGKTNTMPLQIEILNADFQFAAAFALASILSLLAVLTLAIKTYVEWRSQKALSESLENFKTSI